MRLNIDYLKIFFLLILANLSFSAFSQVKTGKIEGITTDEGQKPLPSATVSLLVARDSSVVNRTLSDKKGHFQFLNIPGGRYLVSAGGVGWSTTYSPVFDLSDEKPVASLANLSLYLESGQLATVAVIAKKPFFEQKAGRMVINVDASPASAGSTAMDVLERSPGVTVDKDDNISLKGKAGVTIMVDGKPTYMSSTQLAGYLRSLPASAIDQIELMTNPSAKYDAAGNSGIINIKIKKIKAYGFNGSIALSDAQGVYGNPGGNFNLNYRDGKANFFLNGGYTRWEGFRNLDITRTYIDTNAAKTVNSIFSQQTASHFVNPTFNAKFGMDYDIDKRTTVGFVVSGFMNTESNNGTSNILLEDPNHVVDSIVYSPSHTKTTWKNRSVNLNFRRRFDSLGTELTADADYVNYTSSSDQYFDNTTYSPDWTKKGETSSPATCPAISIFIRSRRIMPIPSTRILKWKPVLRPAT